MASHVLTPSVHAICVYFSLWRSPLWAYADLQGNHDPCRNSGLQVTLLMTLISPDEVEETVWRPRVGMVHMWAPKWYFISHNTATKTRHMTHFLARKCHPLWTHEEEENQVSVTSDNVHCQKPCRELHMPSFLTTITEVQFVYISVLIHLARKKKQFRQISEHSALKFHGQERKQKNK